MKLFLSILMLMMIFQEDGGGGTSEYRRYQNLMIPPYSISEGTRASFQFFNTYGDDITLAWRLSNSKYHEVLVYIQSFSPRMMIQKTLDLPGTLFDGGVASLKLYASRANYASNINIQVHPRQNFLVQDLTAHFLSSPTITRLDGSGLIKYEHEHLRFEGMAVEQFHQTYGRLNLSNMKMRILTVLASDIEIRDARLLIANHPSLEGLNLISNEFRSIPLNLQLIGDTVQFFFPQLYVHPKNLMPSQIPLQDYVPTHHLFFPIVAFETLKEQWMKIEFTFIHFHQLRVEYTFYYLAKMALFGGCISSTNCVKIYA